MLNLQKLQSNLRFVNGNQAKETNLAVYFALARDHPQWNSDGTATKSGTMGLDREWNGFP